MNLLKKKLHSLIVVIIAISLGVFASYLLVAKGMKLPAGLLFAAAIGIIFMFEEPPAQGYLWWFR